MIVDKEKMIYAGVSVFVLLVLIASTRKVSLKEVSEAQICNRNFDNSQLPSVLKPPKRLLEGEPVPSPIRKNLSLNAIGVKPRFDNDYFNTNKA